MEGLVSVSHGCKGFTDSRGGVVGLRVWGFWGLRVYGFRGFGV